MSKFEDGHSNLVTPDPIPNSEVKLITSVVLVSYKRRSADAVFLIFNYFFKLLFPIESMKKTLSRLEAEEEIRFFFNKNSFSSDDVKKIKRLAMKYKIKLKKYRKLFCKKCLSQLRGKTRTAKNYKTIGCEKCDHKNRFKI